MSKLMTREGYEEARARIDKYRKKLAEVRAGKGEAAETGGNAWHDNAAFEGLTRMEDLYSSHIQELESQISGVRIIDESKLRNSLTNESVVILSTATIKYPDSSTRKLKIVGSGNSNLKEGRVAYDTPLGRAIIGKKAGEKGLVEIDKNHKFEVEVLRIE